jgi:hypothetical protein
MSAFRAEELSEWLKRSGNLLGPHQAQLVQSIYNPSKLSLILIATLDLQSRGREDTL